MNLLALDLSLTASGWARALDDHGTIRTPKKGAERLGVILDEVAALAYGDQPVDVVLIEGYAYAAHNRAHQVGELGGVIRLELWRAGVPFVEIAPPVLKKYATGKGNSPKPELRMALYKRTGLDVSDDNQVDAVWLVAAGFELAGAPIIDVPQAQRDALGKVEWPT